MAGRLAYFGLPLGALLLVEDGHQLALAVVPPVEAPGLRRLRKALPESALFALPPGNSRTARRILEAEVPHRLSTEAPDLLVSWYYTRKISDAWLKACRLGGIGVHPSLLPRHRGPDPFYWAIDQGDAMTGVTAHKLTSEYDAGAILLSESIPVGQKNAWQLARALDRPSLAVLRRTTRGVLDGTLRGEPQDATKVTLAPAPTGLGLKVDFSWATERVLRRIRALSPVPGLALSYAGHDFFIISAQVGPRPGLLLEPGEMVFWGDPPKVFIATADGAVTIERAVLSEEPEAPACVPTIMNGPDLARFLQSRGFRPS